MTWEVQPSSLLLAFAYLYAGRYILIKLFTRVSEDDKIWAALPTVGIPSKDSLLNIFPIPWRLLARFQSITSTASLVSDGYYRFGKGENGRAFALPTMWTGSNVVVLPPSMVNVYNRNRDELSSTDALLESVRLRDTGTDPSVLRNVFHFDVVRKDLNQKNVGQVAADSADELGYAMRLLWGTNPTEWATVNAWQTCTRIISRTALRIMIGQELCRDNDLVESSVRYAETVIMDSVLISCLPTPLRILAGPISKLRAKYHRKKMQKRLLPHVEERLRLWQNANDGDKLPNDTLQWLIPKCASEGDEELDPVRIMARHLSLSTMFLFAMVWSFFHCLIDIYTSPEVDEVVAALREEAERVSRAHAGGLRNAQAVNQLHRFDSALRESSRVSDVMIHFMPLDVIAGDGFDIGHGLRIPVGSSIRSVFPTQAIHLDPDNYEDPHKFDAFRFSRPFENGARGVSGDELLKNQSTTKHELMATCTPTFLTFGYGRHACPGRFILAQLVKQALAMTLMDYDVEHVGQKRNRQAMLWFMVPQEGTQIRVRRKL